MTLNLYIGLSEKSEKWPLKKQQNRSESEIINVD